MQRKHQILLIFSLLILCLSSCAKEPQAEGLSFYDAKGKLEFRIAEEDGAVVWYGKNGTEAARCAEPRRDMHGRVETAPLTVDGEELTLLWSYGVYDLGLQADAPLGCFSIRNEAGMIARARWFRPDGGVYYDVSYTFDEENRPILLHSTGAEPEFCYYIEWEYEEDPWLLGADKTVITERKYETNGDIIYWQTFANHRETLDDYRDLDAEHNHFDYSIGWKSLPIVNPHKMEYDEGGVHYQVRAEKQNDGRLLFYERIGTEDGEEVYRYTYRREEEDLQIVEEWKKKYWDGMSGSHFSRLVYRADDLWPMTCYEEFYNEQGELAVSLNYDAEIGYTNITEHEGETQTVRLLREKRDSRGYDGGCYWAQVEQLDENGSKIEFACLRGAMPEYFLPGAVRHFVRCNELGEAVKDVYFHSGNILVTSYFAVWE